MSGLLGIFLAEFDNVLGPKVSYQVPPQVVPTDIFQQVSDYIIPDSELCFKFITLTLQGHTIAGYPVRIENKKYHRNQLVFNLGVIIKPNVDTNRFEPLCRKIGEVVKTLEIENEFVFDQSKRSAFQDIIVQVFYDLKSSGETTIRFDNANIVTLKILPALDPPITVQDHEVPVLVKDISPQFVKHWDFTLHQILPFLDGVNHIKKISILAEVDVAFVKACIRQLTYYGLVHLIDIFQFSNTYRIDNPKQLQLLYTDIQFQESCLMYLSSKTSSLRNSKCALDLVFSLFCQMSSRCSLEELSLRNSSMIQKYNLNIRRVISFGLLNKIIARVHKYPVLTSKFDQELEALSHRNMFSLSLSPSSMSSSALSSLSSTPSGPGFSLESLDLERHLLSLLDGKHCLDRICVEFEKSLSEMMEVLIRIPHLTFLSM